MYACCMREPENEHVKESVDADVCEEAVQHSGSKCGSWRRPA